MSVGKLIDLTGRRFGRLTVIERAENYVTPKGNKESKWICLCDCGNTIKAIGNNLRRGKSRSCGCLQKEVAKNNPPRLVGENNPMFKHGEAGANEHRLYRVFAGMKARCYNPNHKHYKYYGGLGISVCDEWRNDYVAFREWAMANGYDPDAPRGACTIDRIDVDGNYCPENCRWVSMAVQNQNKQNSKHKER